MFLNSIKDMPEKIYVAAVVLANQESTYCVGFCVTELYKSREEAEKFIATPRPDYIVLDRRIIIIETPFTQVQLVQTALDSLTGKQLKLRAEMMQQLNQIDETKQSLMAIAAPRDIGEFALYEASPETDSYSEDAF